MVIDQALARYYLTNLNLLEKEPENEEFKRSVTEFLGGLPELKGILVEELLQNKPLLQFIEERLSLASSSQLESVTLDKETLAPWIEEAEQRRVDREKARAEAKATTEKFVAGQKEIYLKQKSAQPIKVELIEGIKVQEVAKEVRADSEGFVEGFVQKATRLSNIPEGMNVETVQVLAPIAALDLAEKLKEVPSGAILEEITPLPDQAFLLAHLASLKGLSRRDIENLYSAGLGQALRNDLLGKIIQKQYPEAHKVFYSPARQEFEEAQQGDAVATKIDLKETLQRAQELAEPLKLTPDLTLLQRFLTGIGREIFRKPDTFVYSGDAAALSRQQILLQLHPKMGDLAANRLLMWDENKLSVSVPLQQMMPQLGLTIRGEASLGLGPFSKALKIPGVSAFVQKTTSALAAKLAGTAVGKTAIKFGTWAATRLGVNLIPVVGQILSVLTIAWDAIKFALKKLFNNPELLALLAAPFLLLSFVNPLFLLPGGMFLGSALWVGGTPAVFGGFGLLLRGLGNLFTGAILPGIAGPLIGTLIGLPVLVALILFIINSGAYVVPPGAGFVPGTQQCTPGGQPIGEGIINPGQTVKIMPLGDSITKGYLSEYPGYRGFLQQRLQENGYNVDFVGTSPEVDEPTQAAADDDHEGHGNQNTQYFVDNVANFMQRSQPDVVLLHVGTVNLTGLGIETNADNVGRIIEIIQDPINNPSGRVPKIVLAKIIKRCDGYENETGDYNDLLEQYRGKPGVTIVDMESVLECNSNDYLGDGVHPTLETGYQKMADRWFESLTGSLAPGEEAVVCPTTPDCPSGWPFAGSVPPSRQGPYTHDSHRNAEALDLSLAYKEILATHDGIAKVFPTDSGAFGKHVEIVSECNGKSFYSRYAHLNSVSVSDGQPVQRGTSLGISGDTGNSTGPHLHYEFRYLSPDRPTGGSLANYLDNPPFLAKDFIPQNAKRGCLIPAGIAETCLVP